MVKKDEKELPAPHPDQLKKDGPKPTEVVEERTETEKVFDNNDGTFTKKVYTEPIHTEKDGKLEEVSPKLVTAPDEKIVTENGSGAKKLNNLKMVTQTWSYWYYYFKRLSDRVAALVRRTFSIKSK
ncbi:hypothetical protein P4379_18535 [Bacillus toyonensis]|nr:hypothetical protein [Bacillus toyonensis]